MLQQRCALWLSLVSAAAATMPPCAQVVEIPEGVTAIPARAYLFCSELETVTIPDSVTSIGMNAFFSCSSLTSVVIPDGVTSIPDGTFEGCSSLTSIVIPGSVTSIGWRGFHGCTSLTSIEFQHGLTHIGNRAFGQCTSLRTARIPDSVTSIDDSAFSSCSSLTTVELPDSLMSMGAAVFDSCSLLTTVELPDSLTSMGTGVFQSCSSLTNVGLPDSLTNIPNHTFFGCSSLADIEIPDSVTSFGAGAFAHTSLTTATAPRLRDSMTSIPAALFAGCTLLTAFEIPDRVTSIQDSAFSGCTALTSIAIPDRVTSIGGSAFSSCSSLTTIELPRSVTSLGMGAFVETPLTSIVVGNGLTSIGDWAFESWTVPTAPIVYVYEDNANWDGAIGASNFPVTSTIVKICSLRPLCDVTYRGDGTCNPECNIEACNMDGGDCAAPPTPAPCKAPAAAVAPAVFAGKHVKLCKRYAAAEACRYLRGQYPRSLEGAAAECKARLGSQKAAQCDKVAALPVWWVAPQDVPCGETCGPIAGTQADVDACKRRKVGAQLCEELRGVQCLKQAVAACRNRYPRKADACKKLWRLRHDLAGEDQPCEACTGLVWHAVGGECVHSVPVKLDVPTHASQGACCRAHFKHKWGRCMFA